MHEVLTVKIQNTSLHIPSLSKLWKDSLPPANRPDLTKPLLTLGKVPDVH